ncbi:uncharacterized protein VICG_02064 [Vittaforma corneae ATCC 50505]|uniref:B3/B4 tRNA-binding domain-containing protein n=1 Tax=Vittaforma corneae (strain ATCC 50505) TaxID=993615 RepID=L2GJW2_VITCO|nr:uncharacterized protein VICG_02064 [Vittaforma corneae ATCC 50505]ELA40924.1 hypothetical protein VICG_02064 [Vittaforma corneae ATCC 50505]
MSHTFEVEKRVFEALPQISIFLAVVRDIDLNQLDKDGIHNLFEESWSLAHKQISAYPNVQSHPSILLWRKASELLSISAKKYPSSVESMAKRTTKADSKPFSINPLVDFYNAFSLKYLLPFGGFDMASKATKTLSLRFSRAGDKFMALNADATVDIPCGEVLYASGNTVVTRHINWRQSKEGLIQETTTNACFMAEVLHGYPEARLTDMKMDFKKCCVDLLNVEPELYMIDEANPSITY